MRRDDVVIKVPSVYSMNTMEVYGTFAYGLMGDIPWDDFSIDDGDAWEGFVRDMGACRCVRDDMYFPQARRDDEDYVARLCFYEKGTGKEDSKPAYVCSVQADGELLHCSLHRTHVHGEGYSSYARIAEWFLSSDAIGALFFSDNQ